MTTRSAPEARRRGPTGSARFNDRSGHFRRTPPSRAGRTDEPAVSAAARTGFAEMDRERARARWRVAGDTLRDRSGDVAELMDEAERDVLACVTFHVALRSNLHGATLRERATREAERRVDVVGILPDRGAVIRLVGARMRERDDESPVSRR